MGFEISLTVPLFLDEGSLLLVFSRVGELDECKAGDPYAEQAQDVSWFDLSHNRERCGADPHGEGDCFEDELRQRPRLAQSGRFPNRGPCLEQLVDRGTELLGKQGERRGIRKGEVTLHGPVNAKTELQGSFDLLEDMAICPPEAKKSLDWSGDDERKMVLRERAIREGQGRFRKEVFRAYGGACALTDVNVPEVLQAAHIDPYRGQYTQVVGNGILLRSDIHLLYDAQLLAIRPESHVIEVSKRLLGTPYECLAKAFAGGRPRTLRVPEYSDDAPIEELLELHYREFLIANAAR